MFQFPRFETNSVMPELYVTFSIVKKLGRIEWVELHGKQFPIVFQGFCMHLHLDIWLWCYPIYSWQIFTKDKSTLPLTHFMCCCEGKKSLYIRLGCRGDWPNIKPPGWDPSAGPNTSTDTN